MTGARAAADAAQPCAAPTTMRERWLNFRNRLIANPAFQRWAAKFPLTRPIADKRSRALFDLCGGFVYSQILHTCVALKLFDQMADGPRDLDDVARNVGLDADAMRRLAKAAVSLDLFEWAGTDRLALGQLGAAMAGNPAIGRMVEHHSMLYADLADPVALLRGSGHDTALGAYWGYGGNSPEDAEDARPVADYTALMSASQTFVAEDVLEAYDFAPHARLMDVGGGDGTFIQAVAAAHPHLSFLLYDRPAVADLARQNMNDAGLSERVEAVPGDFLNLPLPTGADIISLVRVVHDHDDEDILRLLRAAHAALGDSGTLIIAEPLAQAHGDPITDAYFGFYFLAMGSGRTRTFDHIADLLRQSGFGGIRQVRTRRPLFTGLIVATVS